MALATRFFFLESRPYGTFWNQASIRLAEWKMIVRLVYFDDRCYMILRAHTLFDVKFEASLASDDAK